MSRPRRMTRWYVRYADTDGFRAYSGPVTRRQAERRAARALDPEAVVLVLRCYRKSKKFPRGFERDYGVNR